MRNGLPGSLGHAALLGALILCSFAQAKASACVSSAWGGLTHGEYAVGFQTVNKYDFSRTYETKLRDEGGLRAGQRARPIQIWIWYPGKTGGNDQCMSYEDYIYLSAAEAGSGVPSPKERDLNKTAFIANPVFRNVPAQRMSDLFKMRTDVIKNASPREGHFPLIVFGQGYQFESPLAHSVLCEYLTSHGYVVAAVPYRGYPLPQSFHDLAELENEVRDLEFVISYMHDFPTVDHDRLGVAGFDYGGMAALLLAMRNTDVDAVVGMDSGIMFRQNTALLKQSPSYKPGNLRVPLMQITRTKAENEDGEDSSLFETAKYSATYLVRIKGMEHENFSAYRMLLSTVLSAEESSQKTTKLKYQFLCRYILNFLDAYVQRNKKTLAYIEKEPESKPSARGFLTVERKRAVKAPPTEREFVQIIADKGVVRAAQLYSELKRSDPEYILFKETTLRLLGHKLTQEHRIKDAVDIFKLDIEAYPQSWKAYDSLGEAYIAGGEKELAMKNYRRSLDLNPQNTNAVDMLKKLTAQ